ncbi:OmpP1/FadL family transporter [Nitrogeniibacter aestuarii]|uniref:OmpP1/FadL family transporter n=1 Tax=Nitrogeniibacter aestuarii TaxID=2815343 RepID=UPI001E30FBCC|nr:outer membrane protein transport protein [Nitrogeniibacter aestuarii]
MKMKQIARLVPIAMFALAGSQASAAGFQLLEQNASGLGNAYAGTAAVAEDASTIFFNPAGMTQLQAREFSVGLDFVRPSFEFSNEGSQSYPNIAATGSEADDAGSWAAIPNAYLSWALTDRLYVGVGMGAPFGLKTEYNDDWVGAAQATLFDIKTININPSLAFKVNDVVSLGIGLNWQRMEAQYERVATATPQIGALPAIVNAQFAALRASKLVLDADDDSWGWNVGALFNISPTTKVGVAYRSKIKHELEGSLKAEGTANATLNAAVGGDASADVELPDTFTLSVAQQLNDRWEMLGDVSWTGWSSIQDVDIYSDKAGRVVQTLETKFRDTWRIALGANYQLNDAWKLKFGVAYDQTPVQNQSDRLVSLPDANRTWLSVGGQWKLNPQSRLDMGLAYLIVDDTKINNDQLNADLTSPTSNRGKVTGEYSSSVIILGAQYSMSF